MSSYTNLEQHLIDRSTAFFNKLDVNKTGVVSIQQIIDVCIEDSIRCYGRYIPPWLTNLSQYYTPETIISKQDYDTKKAKHLIFSWISPKLTLTRMMKLHFNNCMINI